jgi:streptogrisin C
MNRRVVIPLAVACASALVAIATGPAGATAPAGQGPGAARPAPADAQPAPDPAPPEVMAALRRDLGLTQDQVRARLDSERAAGRVDRRLRKVVGDAYAGSWLSADGVTLTVAVTDPSSVADVRSVGATARLVAFGAARLDAVKSRLDALAPSVPRSIAGWYVDGPTNSVVLLARDTRAARALVTGLGADAGMVRVIRTVEDPRVLYDVRGADAYYIGGARCSIGFSVTGGFVSAGHCGDIGDAVEGYNGVAMGTFRGSEFPGNDYSWVQVTSSWTPRGVVNNYLGGTVSVTGSQEAVVGASVCRSGSTTGWHCGTIQARNATVTYAEGTVTGLTRTNVCAEPGDSGGSWLSGGQAQGVTSGGSGDCASGGTTYFQPVNEILSAYGLTLVTSSGGGTPPPPTGCTGRESTYTGTLASGSSQYRPGTSGFSVTASGVHRACLDGPTGADFDLYLQKRSGSSWVTVASATSEEPDETLTYSGTAGVYRYRVYAYDGSGAYTLGVDVP